MVNQLNLPTTDAHCPPAVGLSVCIYLLGELQIVCSDESVPLPPYRTRSLLAFLLLHPRPLRRDRLIGSLFPDVPERAGRRRLSDLLWLLRRSLPQLSLETNAQEVYLPPETRWLDVEAFQKALARDGLGAWLEALALYRGDLVAGVYDEWLLADREALYLQYVRLSHRACDELLWRRRFDEMLPLAERLVQDEPYDEKALRTLMRAYRAVGRRGAALAAYEQFFALAADELGSEPEAATQSLAQAIRHVGSHVHLDPTPIPAEDDTPQMLLRRARDALSRGDRVAVEDSLRHLRSHPACCEGDVCLLEVDLALFYEQYERAARLLEGCDSQRAPVLVRSARLALSRRQVAVAHQVVSRALILASDTGDRQSELEALLILAEAQRKLGQALQAARSEEQAVELARVCASPLGVARALVLQGYRQIRQGRYAEALAPLYEARSLAYEHGFRRSLARALRGIGLARSYGCSSLEAQAAIEEELGIWRDLGLQGHEASTLHNLAFVQTQLGRMADCLRTLEQARQICEQLGDPVQVAINEYHLANTLLCHDDALAPRAAVVIQEALATFQSHDEPGWEAAAWSTLGQALWLGEQHVEALDAFYEAYTRYTQLGELGFLPELLAYQGLAHLGLGEITQALYFTRQALVALAQGEVSDEAVSDVYYAHAVALDVNGEEDQAQTYFTRAYQNLLAGAAQLEDEPARQAFFHRSPAMRRLMQAIFDRGIALRPDLGIISRRLPAARSGGYPVQVTWTVDAGPADVALKQARGAIALRRARLSRLLQEAQAQGAAPTVAHLAKVLGVSKRTVQRDLAALRHE